MEFVVIVLFVAAILLVNFLMDRARKKRHDAGPAGTEGAVPERPGQGAAAGQPAVKPKLPAGASAETARAAASHLDPEQHRQVYAAIAQGQAVRAVKLYAQFTGSGLRTASVAVTSLAAHPQPKPKPRGTAAPVQTSQETPAGFTEHPETGKGQAADPEAPARGAAGDPDRGPESGPPPAAGSAGAGKAGAPAADSGSAGPLPDDAEISRWAQNLRPEDF